MKRNNIEEMHKQMFILVNLLKKDTRNRKSRLEKVIAVKRFALEKVQEKIAKQVEKELSDKLPEATGK